MLYENLRETEICKYNNLYKIKYWKHEGAPRCLVMW